MADKIRNWTDRQLSEMEKRISDIYKDMGKNVVEQWNAFMSQADEEMMELQTAYDDAKKSGDKKLTSDLESKLAKAKKEITFQNEHYQAMIDETTYQLAHVNETALAYMNGEMPSIYMNNYNDAEADADKLGINFSIMNEATVKRLITDGELSLLRDRLDIPKDQRWNRKQLNSAVLQGILGGESMQEIAKRIYPITNRNEASAIRNARTMVTYAENKGKIDSMNAMEAEGAVYEKIWMAIPDGRARDWHLEMDGQAVRNGQYFIDGLGNKLEEPGDKNAPPETVYNCRCGMWRHPIGFRKADGRIQKIEFERPAYTLHEQQIADERKRRERETKGKDREK